MLRASIGAWGACLLFGVSGLVPGCATAPKPSGRAMPWPADAVFQGYPVIHCSREEVPPSLLAATKASREDETPTRVAYETTRDTVLTTLNLFLATGRWTGTRAQIKPTRELPRIGSPTECRMFELALADEITLRLPPSVTGAPYIAPIGMVGYDYEPGSSGGPPKITVRIAALLARGDGRVLRTISTVATTDYARTAPFFQERGSFEVAQDLTEQIARGLSKALE